MLLFHNFILCWGERSSSSRMINQSFDPMAGVLDIWSVCLQYIPFPMFTHTIICLNKSISSDRIYVFILDVIVQESIGNTKRTKQFWEKMADEKYQECTSCPFTLHAMRYDSHVACACDSIECSLGSREATKTPSSSLHYLNMFTSLSPTSNTTDCTSTHETSG